MITTIGTNETNNVTDYAPANAWSGCAVSWGAIFAGAAGAAALSLILLILGTGLGLSTISPWAKDGIEAKTLGVSGILWITLTSIFASGLGGYLAGRLRTKWASTLGDEVFFRDTAHGFLSWAVATLLTASLLTSAVGTIIGGGIKTGAAIAGGAASSTGIAAAVAGTNSDKWADKLKSDNDLSGYFIDSLFRKPMGAAPAPDATNPAPATTSTTTPAPSSSTTLPADTTAATKAPVREVARIFANALRVGSLSPADTQYLGQIVAYHTGLTQQEAENRVKGTLTLWQTKLKETEITAKQAADAARKSAAYISLWLFVSLLAGAFTASWLATCGGRQRVL